MWGVREPSLSSWRVDLVQELRVARLATLNSDGGPHLVPVCYAFVGGSIAIAVDEKPKTSTQLARLRNIERDARVSILFDRYTENWMHLAWVRADGTARIAAFGREHPETLDALRQRYRQYRTMDLESRPLILVTPKNVAGWRWSGETGT